VNASVEWLRAFVDSGLSPVALRDLITGRVATVEGVEAVRTDLASLVVGRVLTAERHPDSDHLWVTTVDAGGGEPLDVVCGAPNVTVGVKYPFAPVGTTMPNGMKIEKRKIRGKVSNGMLCSARELQLGDEHEGILPLDTKAAPGTPLLEALPVGDTRLVIDVLPNRPDLLSHQGVAREIAAAVGKSLLAPDAPWRGTAPDKGMVAVAHEGDAPTYVGAVVRGVKVGPSPEWLVRRLATVGVRSINNVVDATNYVLHGYGQPTHAFDLDRMQGGWVAVRRGRVGERLVTLDGVDRALDESMVVIADAKRALALAGVMGGKESEVSEETTSLFVEVAAFDGRRVRATRQKLGLSTDASYRYERGVPARQPIEVYPILLSLLVSLAGASVESVSIVGGAREEARRVTLRTARVARILGEPIASDESAGLLGGIGFESTKAGDDLAVSVPWFRTDIEGEIDLIEEVARLHGYEKFSSEIRPYRPTTTVDAPEVAVSARLRETLVGLGYLEARPMSFVAEGDVRVHNPLAENEAYLRGDLLTPLARRAEYNLDRKVGDIRLFEIGTVFRRGVGRPVEEVRVAALMMGARRPAHFTEPNPPAFDEWDAKGVAERLAADLWPGRSVRVEPGADVLWEVRVDGAPAGVVRRVALDAPPWAKAAYGVEMLVSVTETGDVAPPGQHQYQKGREGVEDQEGVGRGTRTGTGTATHRVGRPQYVEPPGFPAVERDVTLLVPDGLLGGAGKVELLLRGGGLVERVELISEYRGPGVPDGTRSVTWRLTFRHPARTLTEKEVDTSQRKLLRTLETELGVRQRTA
jgi:phenylalanyl-tRNA synthetase beta chain